MARALTGRPVQSPMFLALLLPYMHQTKDVKLAIALREKLAWMGLCEYVPHYERPSAEALFLFRNRPHEAGMWDSLMEVVNEQFVMVGLSTTLVLSI